MLNIYKSNSLASLAEKLSSQIKKNIPDDPFIPISILVPNLDTSRWLKLQLSELNGIVANIEFLLPAEWQFRLIRKLYKNLPQILPSDPGPLTWTVFELLMNDDKRKLFSRADRYINAQPAELKEQAAMQLAEKISSVYDQYLVYRPELILKWQAGKHISDTDEQWQAAMWNLLEMDRKKREKGKGYPNRAELLLEVTEAIKNTEITSDAPIHLFNTGLVPKSVVQMAQNLSIHTPVTIYQISLCRLFDNSSADSNPLLDAFGEEARGTELLYRLPESSIESVFVDHSEKSGTFLKKIQQTILNNRPIDSWNSTGEKETSIEIHICHTPLREIEVLHQFILRSFEADSNLNPDDIIVVMPDPEIYKPFIHAVFGSESKGVPAIPYHMGFSSAGDTGITRLFLQLLDIADSRMEFAEVIDLFMEEPIREHFDVTESGAGRIKRWMQENHVIWGMDSEHRGKSEQPIEEIHTWQSAMKRGWMGMVMGEQENPFLENDLHFLQVRGSDREMEWSSFSSFLRLLHDFSTIIESRRSVGNWCDKLNHLLTTFFSKESLMHKDALNLSRSVEKIRESAIVSGIEEVVSFSVIRRLVRNTLTTNSASTANFTRGVTFSSMVPVRSIPAKIIAMIGLNESDFPRKPKHIDFDLMAHDPEPTERNRKNEDRNLFLESIMAAENFHYCSYIGRSRRDNEPIPPSPIISEWVTQLGKALNIKPKKLIQDEPLHGFSAENFRQKKSYAITEFSVAKLLAQKNSDQPGLYLTKPISVSDDNSELPIKDLLNFFSNPIRAFFKEKFQPGINGPDEKRDEFVLNNLEKHKLFEQVFGWKLEGIIDKHILKILYKTGIVPAGWQGESMLKEIIDHTNTAIQFLDDINVVPELKSMDVDIQLTDIKITGSVNSYSNHHFLDITPSTDSGSKILKSWICHLALTHNGKLLGKKSHFLCDLKKGDPTFITFHPIENPEFIISSLVEIFRDGISHPSMLFPDTSFEYEKAIIEGKGREEYKAVAKFEGNQYQPFAENKDVYLSFLAGEDPPFSMNFINPKFQSVIKTMLNHMES